MQNRVINTVRAPQGAQAVVSAHVAAPVDGRRGAGEGASVRTTLPIVATCCFIVLLAGCPADEDVGGPADTSTIDVEVSDASPSADTSPDSDDTADAPSGVCADYQPHRRVLWGDLHVHTALSLDANLQGTRLRPADAYRYARGEAVGIQPYDEDGLPLRTLQLERPLDFAAVTDHAEFLGAVMVCSTEGLPGYDHPQCQQFRDDPDGAFITLNFILAYEPADISQPALCGVDAVDCEQPKRDAWAETVAAANEAQATGDSCEFTAMIGYEWSANPGTYNLHRNVIFRSAEVPDAPTGYLDAPTVEGLWGALRADCLDAGTSCDVLAIPHNSNLSGGLMFAGLDAAGQEIDAAYAAEQATMEPLVEIFQHKGDSECAPGTPAGDELCGFEKMPYDSLAGAALNLPSEPQDIDYLRDALGEGLRRGRDTGVNPWEMGIIASTDTHIATPGNVSEADFAGHGGAGRSNRDELPPGLPDSVAFNPGGLAAVWAEENTREAIFDALRRRETYGTSGPRITLRFFAGWDYPDSLCAAADLPAQGYAGGVPMGGRLQSAPAGAAPALILSALRDPGSDATPGTQLQRVQVIKVSLDGDAVVTSVIDVAGGAGDADVDATTCAPTGASGHDALCAVWTDPAFDPEVPALYYARALENPTCRWTTRQCVAAGVDCADPDTIGDGFSGCCDARFEATVQERAWSSPIWYLPGD